MAENSTTLGKFLGRIAHPVGYPHSGIPYGDRFPNLTGGGLARIRKDNEASDRDRSESLRFLADDLRELFGVPLPGDYPGPEETYTPEGNLAHQTGGSHGDQRRAIDDIKDHIIESIALDAETVRRLGRSIDARLAALEALEAMTREAEGVSHE